MNHPTNIAYSSGSDPVRYCVSNMPATSHKAVLATTLPKSVPFSGSYGDGAQSEASWSMQRSYAHPYQPMYRQTPPM